MQALHHVNPALRAGLLDCGWLAGCPDAFAAAVWDHGVVRAYERGDVIYRAGEPASALFGVAQGAVLFTLGDGRATHRPADLATRGGWFGDVGLFAEGNRAASAFARVSSQLLVLEARAIERMTAQRPEWWRPFATLAAINHARVLRASSHFFERSPEMRVAAKLLHLSAETALPVIATQSEIAAMTGLSRNKVNRVLSDLEGAGVVRNAYGRISVLDRGRLAEVVTATPEAKAAAD